MGRPVYPHELADSDFSWLINSYRESNPNSILVESSCLPLVLIKEDSLRGLIEPVTNSLTPPIVEDPEGALIDHSEKE